MRSERLSEGSLPLLLISGKAIMPSSKNFIWLTGGRGSPSTVYCNKCLPAAVKQTVPRPLASWNSTPDSTHCAKRCNCLMRSERPSVGSLPVLLISGKAIMPSSKNFIWLTGGRGSPSTVYCNRCLPAAVKQTVPRPLASSNSTPKFTCCAKRCNH